MKICHDVPFEVARGRAYPRVGDQLDAVFKLAEALRAQGVSLPPEVNAWIDECRAVKTRIPRKALPAPDRAS